MTKELYSLLQRRRIHVDDAAIHFISQPKKNQTTDARNSIFKLAQKYQAIPDSENLANIKKMIGNVGGEDEDSGDEEWEPSYKKLPTILRQRISSKTKTIDENPSLKDYLISEMDNIENEASKLVELGVVTVEEIPQCNFVSSTNSSNVETGINNENKMKLMEHNVVKDSDDSDEEDLNAEEIKRYNTLQMDFMGQNLQNWYYQMAVTYKNGVKLVKVNAMGKKFIRLVRVADEYLFLTQPHSISSVKMDRKVFVLDIEKVDVGQTSKEFEALNKIIREGSSEMILSANVCASVHLANKRSISLIFLKEDQRNSFVFFLRVWIKKIKMSMEDKKIE